MPTWGVKIECDGKGCNGLPCEIDPARNNVNEMVGSSSNGAGGGAFCVVTVPKDVNANFVVFDGSGGTSKSDESEETGSGRVDSGLDDSGLGEAGPSISASTSEPSSSAKSDPTYLTSSSWSSSPPTHPPQTIMITALPRPMLQLPLLHQRPSTHLMSFLKSPIQRIRLNLLPSDPLPAKPRQ